MPIEWMLYLADVTDRLSMLFSLLSVGLAISGMGLIVSYYLGSIKEEDPILRQMIKWFCLAFTICSLTVCLLPSKKTMLGLSEKIENDQRKNTNH